MQLNPNGPQWIEWPICQGNKSLSFIVYLSSLFVCIKLNGADIFCEGEAYTREPYRMPQEEN